MLWIYYAFLKPDTTLLITINSVGFFIQTIYICFYLFYAPKSSRLQTVMLLLLLNVFGLGLIVVLTQFLAKGSTRADIVGWICLVFSLCVFVAPLGVVRQVIRTKSVEYMPFPLSFFLTLSAVMWFFYGLLRKDYNIALWSAPNGALYNIQEREKVVEEKIPMENHNNLPELKEQIIDVVKLSAVVCPEITPVVPRLVDDHALILDVEKTPAQNWTSKLLPQNIQQIEIQLFLV
ncbi:hypothetical protein DH2020_048474 [Rehmannia glutinosa]|uniref:Bidirectional sugar transporter SWEET n=1 Tax=Rehmannia glutinosa TaxID=99300 RepID=A0ABR0U5J6_REHGL